MKIHKEESEVRKRREYEVECGTSWTHPVKIVKLIAGTYGTKVLNKYRNIHKSQ